MITVALLCESALSIVKLTLSRVQSLCIICNNRGYALKLGILIKASKYGLMYSPHPNQKPIYLKHWNGHREVVGSHGDRALVAPIFSQVFSEVGVFVAEFSRTGKEIDIRITRKMDY